jgi:hypothetical protein
MPLTELVPELPGESGDAAASADQPGSEATEDSQVVSLTIPKQEPRLAQELVPEFQVGRIDAPGSTDQLGGEATEDSQVLSLTIPKQEPRLARELVPWLCGLYICYRYSFEVSLEHLVAREVLYVWNDEGTLRFYLWYVRGGDVPGSKVEAFEGIIVPAGRSLMFVGTSEDRCRSLALQYDSGPGFRFCRFGIMTSTKTRDPKVPVAACTVMIKLEGMPDNWKEWGTSGSGIIGVSRWEEIIEKDFDPNGTKDKVGNGELRVSHEEWMRRFLDNTPLVDPNTAKADSIMRLNMERFGFHMDLIRTNVLAATGGDVPFGMQWRMRR